MKNPHTQNGPPIISKMFHHQIENVKVFLISVCWRNDVSETIAVFVCAIGLLSFLVNCLQYILFFTIRLYEILFNSSENQL